MASMGQAVNGNPCILNVSTFMLATKLFLNHSHKLLVLLINYFIRQFEWGGT
jgi:hypothetical protein